MSNKQHDVFSGSAAKYIEDTLVKEPETVLKLVQGLHPAAKKATETSESKSHYTAWASCVKKNGENREPCKLDAAKCFERDYSIPAARIYHHCYDTLSKYNECKSNTPGQCSEFESALRDCASASKSKSLPGL